MLFSIQSCSNNQVKRLQRVLLWRQFGTYLWTGELLVLLPLSHFDRRLVSHSRDQEVHKDVLTVGGAIHQSPQRLRQVVSEQVVVVPVGKLRVSHKHTIFIVFLKPAGNGALYKRDMFKKPHLTKICCHFFCQCALPVSLSVALMIVLASHTYTHHTVNFFRQGPHLT